MGQIGVIGFFVLSGYLLQKSFLRLGAELNITKFYDSKSKRLLPSYAASLLWSLLLVTYVACQNETGTLTWMKNWYYWVPSFFMFAAKCNVTSWYMGCIIIFMLIAPFLFYLNRRSWGIPVLLAGAFLYATLLYWWYDGTAFTRLGTQSTLYMSPWARLWEFLAGMITCTLAARLRVPYLSIIRPTLSVILLVVMAGLAIWVSKNYGQGYRLPNGYLYNVAMVLMTSILIFLHSSGETPWPPCITKTVARLAELTYPFYLFQIPASQTIRHIVKACSSDKLPHGVYALCTFTLTLLAAWLLSTLCRRIFGKSR